MNTLVNFVQITLQNSNAYFQVSANGKTYDLDNYLEKIQMFEELRTLGIQICKSNRTLALLALKNLRIEEDNLVELIQKGVDDESKSEQKEIIAEAMELLLQIGEMRDEAQPFTGERPQPFITMVNMKQVIDAETEEITYERSKRKFKERDITKYRQLLEMIKFHNNLRDERVKAEIKAAKAEARAEAREAKKMQKKSDTFAEKVNEVKSATL